MVELIVQHYPTILALHLVGTFSSLALVIISDSYGLRWILGKKDFLSAKLMHQLHRAIWGTLLLTITAGTLLATPYFSYLITETAFQIKLVFVAALVSNAFLIGKHIDLTASTRFVELSRKEKRVLLLSGAISTTSWIGAFVAANFLPL